MSKGPTPSLLSFNNGKLEKKIVQRVSTCHRCGEALNKDQSAINFIKKKSGFTKSLTTCIECARKIIEKTEDDLAKIKKEVLTD